MHERTNVMSYLARVALVSGDARPEEWNRAAYVAVDTHAKLDVPVNSAEIARFGSVDRHGRTEWDALLAVNLTGVFNAIQASAPAMRRAGSGSIVNVSSIVGMIGGRGLAGYVVSKWGVRGLTKAAALELANDNIGVNSVPPGFIRTAMTAAMPPAVEHVAMQRPGEPEESAKLIVFLTSDRPSFSTCAEFVADSGDMTRNAAFDP